MTGGHQGGGSSALQCKERVAIIENMMRTVMVFLCPACGSRWVLTTAVDYPGDSALPRRAPRPLSRLAVGITRR